jgi:hypothetical protein
MRLKVIACEAFKLEIEVLSHKMKHEVDIAFQSFGLHNDPDKLRSELQAQIDSLSSDSFDYILVGYALCSRGTVGITARDVPLVLFRAHDCITVFLGSRRRYMEEFIKEPGTYYYSPGWVERWREKGDVDLFRSMRETAREIKYRQYVQKYGEDNAKYLIEMEESWINNYSRAAFINMGIGDVERYRAFVREIARDNGWKFEELQGDWRLIEGFIRGEWNEDDFLIVRPGQKVVDVYNEEIMRTM